MSNADLLTAHLLEVLSAAKKKSAPVDNAKIVNPSRLPIKLPKTRIPTEPSVVSFKFLLMNSIKMHPDERNTEDVKLRSIAKKTFKNGAKGVITYTSTDLPGYDKPHVWQQVIRCPVGYTGKISECNSIVVNCACYRFTFVWNWSLWARHASILNAINSRPDMTNPALLIGTCKHLIESMRGIKRRAL